MKEVAKYLRKNLANEEIEAKEFTEIIPKKMKKKLQSNKNDNNTSININDDNNHIYTFGDILMT